MWMSSRLELARPIDSAGTEGHQGEKRFTSLAEASQLVRNVIVETSSSWLDVAAMPRVTAAR